MNVEIITFPIEYKCSNENPTVLPCLQVLRLFGGIITYIKENFLLSIEENCDLNCICILNLKKTYCQSQFK